MRIRSSRIAAMMSWISTLDHVLAFHTILSRFRAAVSPTSLILPARRGTKWSRGRHGRLDHGPWVGPSQAPDNGPWRSSRGRAYAAGRATTPGRTWEPREYVLGEGENYPGCIAADDGAMITICPLPQPRPHPGTGGPGIRTAVEPGHPAGVIRKPATTGDDGRCQLHGTERMLHNTWDRGSNDGGTNVGSYR